MEYTAQLTTVGLACISPEPDGLAFTSHSLSSRRAGLRVACGIAVAIAAWAAVTIAGLAFVLSQITGLYELLRLAGAACLVYLGVKLLLSAGKHKNTQPAKTLPSSGGTFQRGFVTDITNPKSAAFFSSLFATMLPAHAPNWMYPSTIKLRQLLNLGCDVTSAGPAAGP